MFWPPVLSHTFNCKHGSGLCVSPTRGWAIVSSDRMASLHVYDVATGKHVRSITGCAEDDEVTDTGSETDSDSDGGPGLEMCRYGGDGGDDSDCSGEPPCDGSGSWDADSTEGGGIRRSHWLNFEMGCMCLTHRDSVSAQLYLDWAIRHSSRPVFHQGTFLQIC